MPLQYAGIGASYGLRRSLSSATERSVMRSAFEIFDRRIALASANRRLKQSVARDSRRFEKRITDA
jgi:hypothetical protein